MRFARYVFAAAGIWGLLVLTPLYFAEPVGLTRPEFYYGFIGVALAFQFVFFLIATDPVTYRKIMAVAIIEKLAFAVPAVVLYLQGRLSPDMLAAGLIDLFLGVLFVISYVKTPTELEGS
jgi:hypothetical protein